MITVITSDQPRHLHLINRLSEIDSVCAIMQTFDRVHTKIEDPIMDEYFERMRLAENLLFPKQSIYAHSFMIVNNLVKLKDKFPLAFTANTFVVFGCEWIKGDLFNLIKDKAINIHMGIGYRGASCNAHAIYEGRRHLVGATIQKLSMGLDCGEPLTYAYADQRYKDNSMLGMSAVKEAIDKVCCYLSDDCITELDEPLDKFTAYKKKSDFTIEIAKELLK